MKKLVTSLALLCLSSCGKMTYNPDPSLAPTSANYPSAEFQACGKTWLGLAACVVEQDEDLTLTFQTLHKGTLTVTFNDDNPFVKTYAKNEVIKVTRKISESQIIGVMISPDFSGSDLPYESMQGFLLAKIKKGNTYVETAKIRQGNKKTLSIPSPEGSFGYTAKGCGIDDAGKVTAKDGYAKLSYVQAGPTDRPCTISGNVGETRFSYFASHYATEFTPLAIPYIEEKNNQLKVTADNTVSLIALDTDTKFSDNAVFNNFNKRKPHTLRLVTIKGRSVIGLFQDNKWTWFQ